MNKTEYLKQLNTCLKHLPKEDREDALHYYEEYFEDMDIDDTVNISEQIGTPEEIAKEIIANCTEKHIETQKEKGGVKNSTLVIWMIILGIIASPVAIPIAIAAIACLFAFIIVLFSLFLAIACVGLALLFAGISSFIAIVPAPGFSSKIFFTGIGFLSIGIGILLLIAAVLFCELCIRLIAALFKRIFIRKKVA